MTSRYLDEVTATVLRGILKAWREECMDVPGPNRIYVELEGLSCGECSLFSDTITVVGGLMTYDDCGHGFLIP
ncbi:hypothetical protein GCM10010331_44960 [Streptomyces xanthochromogenes]|nr:hypothetical protein GCM10010331_44960 [Streptomyces xanthochromogenes]